MRELVPGEVLRDKYRIERVIGSGGMGVVVLATHLRLSKLVAIELLGAETKGRAEVVQRFAREARAASRLRGEHAVRILDVDDSESGDPFLVMEYLEGADMQQVLEREGPLAVATAVDYVLQACEGVAEAHAAGIVHRDLKPANLFLTARPDGSPLVKLLDFGISKAEEHEADHGITRPDTAIGSPSYMSPEQIKNAGNVDVRSDVWSIGVVLYQLLSGALPFTAPTAAALAARIAADPPRPLADARPGIALALAAAVERCLRKERAERFADVAELARAVAPFGSRPGSGAERIARVIAARPSVASRTPAPAIVSRGGAATPSDLRELVSYAPHTTVSLPDVPRVEITEDASSVSRERSVAEPKAAPARSRVGLYVLVAAVLATGVVVLQRRAEAPALRAGATPARPPPPLLPSEEVAVSSGATPSAALPVTTAISPVRLPVVPRSAGSPSASPSRRDAGARNPMDLDFR